MLNPAQGPRVIIIAVQVSKNICSSSGGAQEKGKRGERNSV